MATLYYEEFDPALKFYETVLGPVGYAEGDRTRGWQVGRGWLTILRGKKGNPQNMELMFELKEVEEVEVLYKAFVEAGARGEAPSDQLMYNPVSYCLVTDPFGVDLVIFSRLDIK